MSKLLSTPSQPIRIIVTPSTPSPYTTYHHAHSHSSHPRAYHPSPIAIGEKHIAYASSSSASGSSGGYVSRVLDFGSADNGGVGAGAVAGARARSFDMTYREREYSGDAEYGYDSEKAGLISSEGEYELSTISSPYHDDQYHYFEPSHNHNHYSPDQALLSPSAPYISTSSHPNESGLGPTGRRRLNILAFMLALVLMALGFVSVIHPDMGSTPYHHVGGMGMGMDAHALKRGQVLEQRAEGAGMGMEFGLEDGFAGLGMIQIPLAEKERAFSLKKRSSPSSNGEAEAEADASANNHPTNKMHIGFVPFPLRHEYDLTHPKAAKSDGLWSRIKRDLIPLPFAKSHSHWGSGSGDGDEDASLESHLDAAVPVLNLLETTDDETPEQADIEVIQFPENEAEGAALDEAMLAKNPRVRVLTAKEVQRMLLEESRERMEKRRKFLQGRT